MPTKKTSESRKPDSMWTVAIQEAEGRAVKLERELTKMRAAIRLMKRQIADGVPWPTTEKVEQS